MGITVNDILKLEILKNAELACGAAGLNREVMRVNFTDSPLDPEDPGYALVSQGDLYIHSFYTDGNYEEQIYNIIRFYIQTGSSCCIGVRYRVRELPERVIRLANQNRYPIIMIDNDIPYGRLIKDISELILTEQLDLHSENKLNRLLYDNLSAAECSELIQYLVPELPPGYRCLYVTFPSLAPMRFRLLKNDLDTQYGLPFLRYQKGGFVIMKTENAAGSPPSADSLLRLFSRYGDGFFVGISGRFEDAGGFVRALKEACSAHEISRITENRITWNDDVSVYNLLLPMRNHDSLRIFCRETLGPLRDYEARHGIELVKTVSTFLETNGNIKKTAERLNTHENTVRFRITKARTILGLLEEPYVFIERVSLALKAEKLL
ncbi:PucR family transcriptional regulator ligand-binding domain-containing protein [[Clostridium] symbiosum]|uniref:PucR family transcriptional regulator n=1 Tax=Clostridium symbiosum TaxID=1512 RepID=UPI001D0653A3|nr:PucR family transcriptional regulator [[Clostridium] symbiosum]MCB6608959.1 PucR family transcriptional regulator ligand-binding domain-containing protein [[Clostridium] symbiosum]MCB6929099.1 PucR family transcriptional regulator ligand-binding domain-containing protein [[Clostridium] symbiosum]